VGLRCIFNECYRCILDSKHKVEKVHEGLGVINVVCELTFGGIESTFFKESMGFNAVVLARRGENPSFSTGLP